MDLKNRFSLGFFPTPLTELKNLSKVYGSYNLFIKRDDHTGLAAGGNKTRKLACLIQEAIELGCDAVITVGAQQSNHCRQTAAACAIANLKCHLVFSKHSDTWCRTLLGYRKMENISVWHPKYLNNPSARLSCS